MKQKTLYRLRAQSCLLLVIEEEQSSVSLIDSETGTIASDSSDLDSDISCFGKITLHVIWCYTISWTLSTGFEEDPEASGLLIPNFLNEYHVVDEEEELYGVKWGKKVYLQNFPKLDRPLEKWVTSFIHDVMHSIYTYNRDCL